MNSNISLPFRFRAHFQIYFRELELDKKKLIRISHINLLPTRCAFSEIFSRIGNLTLVLPFQRAFLEIGTSVNLAYVSVLYHIQTTRFMFPFYLYAGMLGFCPLPFVIRSNKPSNIGGYSAWNMTKVYIIIQYVGQPTKILNTKYFFKRLR